MVARGISTYLKGLSLTQTKPDAIIQTPQSVFRMGGTMRKDEFTDKQFINHIYTELKTDIQEPMRIYGIYNRVLKMIEDYLGVRDDS